MSFSRYGREKLCWNDTSQFARKVAEGVNKHSPLLKPHINGVMTDSIGVKTGWSVVCGKSTSKAGKFSWYSAQRICSVKKGIEFQE